MTARGANDVTGDTAVGLRLELLVGPVAHGGHCVARAADGRVVFVRHALPGERVLADVTEERAGYLRADAVTILEASGDRVDPPCRYAGPDRCGGCDFQHVTPAAQAELKAAVVREQLTRLGRLTPAEVEALRVRVEALPGGALGWRSRLRYTVDAQGRAGLLKHRSHEVVPIDVCAIAVPAIQRLDITRQVWPDDDALEVTASSSGRDSLAGSSSPAGDVTIIGTRDGRAPRRISGPSRVRQTAVDRSWRLDPAAFWQVHPAAPDTLARAVTEMLEPRPGERAWDLYGGAGIFAAALAAGVGHGGAVTLVESDERAVLAASECLVDLANVTIIQALVERVKLRGRPDIVVLDPPRSGAGARVVRMLVESAPRAIAYVACDPAAFGRDVATFRASGWQLTAVRAFDTFPMTHHVECIGLLEPVAQSPE